MDNYRERSVFKIFDNYIRLSELSKCGKIKGSEILEKIKSIGIELKKQEDYKDLHYIDLLDASQIKYNNGRCNYSLASFYILLHGKSWYNNFGFKSDIYKELEHNEKIRKLPLIRFIEEYNKLGENPQFLNIDNFLREFPNINIDMPVNIIVEKINTYIQQLLDIEKKECTPKIQSFAGLIHCSKYLLKYNYYLQFLLL